MLYVTTRNNQDTYTAQRVLNIKRGPDGGLFVPYRLPRFSQDEISALGNSNFNTNLADILNLLFGSRLTTYDIDLSVGRYSVRLRQLGRKMVAAECWHNTDWMFERMVRDLSGLITVEKEKRPETSGWVETGVRIAVLFGIFGELIRRDMAAPEKCVDIAVATGDFSGPMAAWYARAMGLPVGNIVCCCNENAALWDFVCRGQLRTDSVAVKTTVPECDVTVPEGLERLVAVYGGPEEAKRYADALHCGSTYYIEDAFLHRLRQGIYVTVSSEKRVNESIPGIYATHGYLTGPAGALAYAGLQDYRSRTGENRTALILTQRHPRCDSSVVASAMGIAEEDLRRIL